ncbi:MAG: VWA domain-containing protein [Planctomycetes bacterium]|nr:VWA domain-containing protein [Planctomycetota bacterium]
MIALTLAACLVAAAQDPVVKPETPPQVEVVFVLDTTGSMGALLSGAKKKIWAIASEIARGKPSPRLKIGLVAYRDKGDAYVTKVTDLSEDLDKVYGELLTFQAQGGGDTPENVRQGLHDALTKIAWSQDKATLRIMFLVGDAPPHLDYTDVPKVEELCLTAVKAGIIINTVRCGPDPETGRIWKEIADKSEGNFFTIDQTGGVIAVATPFDKELGELSDKLGGTVLAFGDGRRKAAVASGEAKAREYASDAKADRAVAKAASTRHSEDDLIDALREKRVKLEEVKEEQLPEELKKMTPEERKAHLEKKAKEREELRAKIVELSKKRDEFLAEELKKRGAKDSFDSSVLEALSEQAGRKGISIPAKK